MSRQIAAHAQAPPITTEHAALCHLATSSSSTHSHLKQQHAQHSTSTPARHQLAPAAVLHAGRGSARSTRARRPAPTVSRPWTRARPATTLRAPLQPRARSPHAPAAATAAATLRVWRPLLPRPAPAAAGRPRHQPPPLAPAAFTCRADRRRHR